MSFDHICHFLRLSFPHSVSLFRCHYKFVFSLHGLYAWNQGKLVVAILFTHQTHKTKEMRWNVVLITLPNRKYHWIVRQKSIVVTVSLSYLTIMPKCQISIRWSRKRGEKRWRKKNSEQCDCTLSVQIQNYFKDFCVCVWMWIYIQVKLKSMTAELKGNDYIFDGFVVCMRIHNFQLNTLLSLSLSLLLCRFKGRHWFLFMICFNNVKQKHISRTSFFNHVHLVVQYVMYGCVVPPCVWVCAFISKPCSVCQTVSSAGRQV